MEDPPVPISNTEVKLHSAYDTWRAAAWESRSLPVCSKRIVRCKYYPFCIKFVKSKRDSVRSKLYGYEYIISRNRINELATVGTKRKPDFQSSESCRFAQKGQYNVSTILFLCQVLKYGCENTWQGKTDSEMNKIKAVFTIMKTAFIFWRAIRDSNP